MSNTYKYTYVIRAEGPGSYAITVDLLYHGNQIDFFTTGVDVSSLESLSFGPLPSLQYVIYPIGCLVAALLYIPSSDEYNPKQSRNGNIAAWGALAFFLGLVLDYFLISNSTLGNIGLVMAALVLFSALGLISRLRGSKALGSIFASILILMLFLPFIVDELVVAQLPSIGVVSDFVVEATVISFTAIAGAILDITLKRERKSEPVGVKSEAQ